LFSGEKIGPDACAIVRGPVPLGVLGPDLTRLLCESTVVKL